MESHLPRIPASGCRSGRRSAVQARAGRGLAPASRLAWFVLSLALLAGTSLVLLPAVATSMQVAMARSAAGICSVHPASAAFPASEEGGRSHSTHALDCVVCVFAAAGAADGAKHVPTIVEAVRATHPDVATLSRALPPAFLYPPGQAPPAHA